MKSLDFEDLTDILVKCTAKLTYISLKIGEAAKAGAFDWNSEHLMPLKEVILNGF